MPGTGVFYVFNVIESNQHQVFGKMRGKSVLDDGKEIVVKDMMCFAEKVCNRYQKQVALQPYKYV